jgi:glycosyltransferase involved in cell wall biosynthesis
MRISVGIHVQSEPDRLRATLDHLRKATTLPVEIVLLADGPDPAMHHMLETLRDLRQSPSGESRGAAACFNRLLRTTCAELAIFLEAGALVGPGWLERLLAALQADERHGLAGPSTNRSWNMQAVFTDCAEDHIAQTAALAEARFGAAWRTMEPLYCLADFCYAVRRGVVDAIGGADEAYGVGPCWEMDYTLRAARAGFRAVWALSAFVYRRRPTARRQADEARLFAVSKRRYQDKFCGLRLSGERSFYAQHCQGDACRDFAPAERIRLREPLEAAAPIAALEQLLPAGATPGPDQPLVSCIMPTRNRRDWMMQAIAYFHRQDYGERELLIVDDGDVDHGEELRGDLQIRYFHSARRLSIGAKRNRACELSRGALIVHWDDDDWYAPGRLRAQIAPLLAGQADITGLADPCFFQVDRWEFWTCSRELNLRLFVRDVHGGTLAFRRHVFEQLARYPDASLAEDAAFLNTAIARGARLKSLPGEGLFLYVRHGSNAWAFSCGNYIDSRGWRRVGEPAFLAADRAFYAALSSAEMTRLRATAEPDKTVEPRAAVDRIKPQSRVASVPSSLPLVSCIMPTYNRRAFVGKAIEYFLRQDYPNCELVILDDGDDRVSDLVPDLPGVRYVGLRDRLRLGAKRNAAVEASRGEIMVHWDDDDWMDRSRVRTQVSALMAAAADICGTSRVWFCEIASARLSVYQYPPTERRWLYGASLCYRRSLWQQKPFEPMDIGEDTRFVWAPPIGRMLDLDGARVLIAMVHRDNTSSPHPLAGPNWRAWHQESAQDVLREDWPFYRELSRRLTALGGTASAPGSGVRALPTKE